MSARFLMCGFLVLSGCTTVSTCANTERVLAVDLRYELQHLVGEEWDITTTSLARFLDRRAPRVAWKILREGILVARFRPGLEFEVQRGVHGVLNVLNSWSNIGSVDLFRLVDETGRELWCVGSLEYWASLAGPLHTRVDLMNAAAGEVPTAIVSKETLERARREVDWCGDERPAVPENWTLFLKYCGAELHSVNQEDQGVLAAAASAGLYVEYGPNPVRAFAFDCSDDIGQIWPELAWEEVERRPRIADRFELKFEE